jgi:hypothetical protein
VFPSRTSTRGQEGESEFGALTQAIASAPVLTRTATWSRQVKLFTVWAKHVALRCDSPVVEEAELLAEPRLWLTLLCRGRVGRITRGHLSAERETASVRCGGPYS